MNKEIHGISTPSRRSHGSRHRQDKAFARPEPLNQMPRHLIAGLLRTLSKGIEDKS